LEESKNKSVNALSRLAILLIFLSDDSLALFAIFRERLGFCFAS